MSDSEENHSKHHRKRKRREQSPESHKEFRRRHKSHKRKRSIERHDEHKRRVKEEFREVRVKSEPRESREPREPRNRHEHRNVKTEPRENQDVKREPSGSQESHSDHHDRRRTDTREWGQKSNKETQAKPAKEVQKPDFGLSGKLAEDTNIFNGVVIKYSEPPEARMPKKRWRLYPFKGDQGLPTLYIHRQSAYLLGRDRKVADIPIDHPSCSKQHAALQYRLVSYKRANGSTGKQIRLYIIDLESANGTYINNNKIEPRKYVELFEKDVIKFGFSSREYVLLHEHSKDDDESEHES